MRWALDRRRALLCLGAIILLGAALRFYGLRWAAPYFWAGFVLQGEYR